MGISKVKLKNIYFLYAICFASVSYACFQHTHDFFWRIAAFVFSGLFYILSIWYLIERKKEIKRKLLSSDYKPISLFVALLLIILVFSIKWDIANLSTLFFHPFAFLAFFIAFISLTIRTKSDVSDIIRMCNGIAFYFGVFIIVDLIVFNKPILVNEMYLFLVFSLIFSSKKSPLWKIYLLILLIGIMIVNAGLDNRTIAIRIALILSAFYTIELINITKYKVLKIGLLAVGVLFLYGISFHYEEIFNWAVKSNLFNSLDQTDTRTFLFSEIFEELKGFDWIWGRGFLGKYYSYYFDTWQGDAGDYKFRFTSEVGVLNLLLKGGILLILMYFLSIITALKKGLFNLYKSRIAIKITIVLFIQFILLGIENFAAFNTNNLFIWLPVGLLIFLDRIRRQRLKGNISKEKTKDFNYNPFL